MFNAAYKRSNIANAGQTSALTDALKVASAYSFDAFDLQQSAMKANAAKYVSKKQEEAKRNYYETTGQAELDALDTIQDANADYAGKTRMAGLVSTLGGLAYGTSRYFDNKNNRPPAPEKRESADQSAVLEALDNKGEVLKNVMERLEQIKFETPGTVKTEASGTSVQQPKPVSTNVSANQSAGGSIMSKADIKQLAINTGFSPENAGIVVGIAGGESGYDPTNSTKRKIPGQQNLYERDGEDSVGLMQINWGYHKDKGWLQDLGITKREQLLDPATNMKAAKYLYDGRGNFGDWTVYNKGIYKDYL